MSDTVFANGRSIACKVSSGKTIAALPDVCLTPPTPPVGPVPIPYPNTSSASDTDKGSTTVSIGGEPVMLKDQSIFKTSTGNEAATRNLGMGVVTHKITGEAQFIAWSMDVKFEGENVPRHLDLMGHNEACNPSQTPPWPLTASMMLPASDPVCTKLKRELAKTVNDMPPSLYSDEYPSTVAVGKIMRGLKFGASSICSSMVLPGRKYRNFAKGVSRGQKSKVKTCGSKRPNFKYADRAHPYEGHAEAKIIEDFFAKGAVGTLVLSITKAPCIQCRRMISQVNRGKDGKGRCNKIKICNKRYE